MKKTNILLLLFTSVFIMLSTSAFANPPKVLVFSKTTHFRHSSAITGGKIVLEKLGKDNNFEVEATEDSNAFTAENLNKFDAVIFLCTTGDVLNEEQQEVFEKFIQSGKGFVGIHSATDTEYDWPWYAELVGAYFKNHPPGQQDVLLNIVDANHISTSHLPTEWGKTDEIYNFKWISENLNVLIEVDENSYKGGQNGEFHPISWYREYDGGRSFYTALGHDEKSLNDPLLIQHILGGIKYALGQSE